MQFTCFPPPWATSDRLSWLYMPLILHFTGHGDEDNQHPYIVMEKKVRANPEYIEPETFRKLRRAWTHIPVAPEGSYRSRGH